MAKDANLASGYDTNKVDISLSARVANPSNMKDKFSGYGHYADISLAVTLRDLADSDIRLDLNERPAFAQNPKRIVQLLSEESKDKLIAQIIEQYW